jgi:8-oxo-dGTP pyrophosphatase MutT (NUDIX family)
MAARLEEAQAPGTPRAAVIRAAGGVVERSGQDGKEVLVVHRPQYDDWSLPKGKALPGESDEDCAVREVEEETGLICQLGPELPSTAYRDAKGRMKRARYWLMAPIGGELAFRHEVDDARWLPVDEARGLLSYERDAAVLDALQSSERPSDAS